MIKKAYTLAESLIVIMIIGIITAILINNLQPSSIHNESYKKMARIVYTQIEFATKQIIMKNTRNYSLNSYILSGVEYSIENASALNNLIKLYDKYLPSISYLKTENYQFDKLVDTTGTALTSVDLSNFQIKTLKNKANYGIKLFGNCATIPDYIYSPIYQDKRSIGKACGIVFFDVNGAKVPNILGVDQYIVPINSNGLK